MKYNAAGIDVYGVSFDTPEENRAFAEKFSYPFLLLSDETRELGMALDACDAVDASHARRVTAVVDAEGRIERLYGKVDPSRHPGQILADLGLAV